MSEFLTRFGIGSATVDLRLPADVEQGETVDATVEVEGGDSEQTVEAVQAVFKLASGHTNAQERWTVWQRELVEPFTVAPGERLTFDVAIEIPRYAPVTTMPAVGGGISAWIETGLDVDWSVDPSDEDSLNVAPGGEFGALHGALVNRLGFEPHDCDVKHHRGQEAFEVEYRPTATSPYAEAVEELAFLVAEESAYDAVQGVGEGDGLDVLCEHEALLLGGDESEAWISIATTDEDEVARFLQGLLGE